MYVQHILATDIYEMDMKLSMLIEELRKRNTHIGRVTEISDIKRWDNNDPVSYAVPDRIRGWEVY